MATFNVTCSQKLDDGDTALIEEHRAVDQHDLLLIIKEYQSRSASHDYVVGCNISIDIFHH